MAFTITQRLIEILNGKTGCIWVKDGTVHYYVRKIPTAEEDRLDTMIATIEYISEL